MKKIINLKCAAPTRLKGMKISSLSEKLACPEGNFLLHLITIESLLKSAALTQEYQSHRSTLFGYNL